MTQIRYKLRSLQEIISLISKETPKKVAEEVARLIISTERIGNKMLPGLRLYNEQCKKDSLTPKPDSLIEWEKAQNSFYRATGAMPYIDQNESSPDYGHITFGAQGKSLETCMDDIVRVYEETQRMGKGMAGNTSARKRSK